MIQEEASLDWQAKHDDVIRWRYDELIRAGAVEDVAWSLALSDADLRVAVSLLARGCPSETARRILL